MNTTTSTSYRPAVTPSSRLRPRSLYLHEITRQPWDLPMMATRPRRRRREPWQEDALPYGVHLVAGLLAMLVLLALAIGFGALGYWLWAAL